jgi:hypothetical protein
MATSGRVICSPMAPSTPPTRHDGAGNYSTSSTEILMVVGNSDGSLTMRLTTLLVPSDPGDGSYVCPSLSWLISGSTATISGGQTCPDPPGPTESFTSGSFVLSSGAATLRLGLNSPASGEYQASTGDLIGTCAKDVPDAGVDASP